MYLVYISAIPLIADEARMQVTCTAC